MMLADVRFRSSLLSPVTKRIKILGATAPSILDTTAFVSKCQWIPVPASVLKLGIQTVDLSEGGLSF
jgi:hypothetical protein